MLPNKQKVGVQANRKVWRFIIACVVIIFILTMCAFMYKLISTVSRHPAAAMTGQEPAEIDNPDQSLQSASQTIGTIPDGLSNMEPAQNNGAVTQGGGTPMPLVAQGIPNNNNAVSSPVQTVGGDNEDSNGQSPADLRHAALVAGQDSDLSPSGFQSGSAGSSSPTASPVMNPAVGASSPQIGGLGQTAYNSQNAQTQKVAFAQTPSSPDVLGTTLQNPVASLVVSTGSIIPAILQTGINSDLPGEITAVVSQNVYDSRTGNSILIPQGSKLIGIYDSNISYGQSRVLMVWNRIIYPNGQYIDLGSMPGADLSGYSGISDQVNNHYLRLYANALLMSLFSAGIQLSQPQTNTNTQNPTSGQIIAGAVGQQLGQVGAAQAQKNMNIQPTLNIRPGDGFNVLVTRDIPFAAAYAGDDSVPPTQSGQ